MTAIERRHRPSRKEFERDFLKPRRPVVITGVMDEWPATKRWSQEFFRERYGSETPLVLLQRHQSEDQGESFNAAGGRWRSGVKRGIVSRRYPMRPVRLDGLIDTFRSGAWEDPKRPPYLWWSLFREHPELNDDLGPLAFYPNWLAPYPALSDRIYGWRALLLSPKSATYNLHFDEMGVHALILQFEGRKRFVLYPPDQARALYDGRVDPDAPDYERFPEFRHARGRIETVLAPGEIIFTPCYWWHQVTSIDHSVSVVVHAVNHSNVADTLREIVWKRGRMLKNFVLGRPNPSPFG